MLPTKMIVSLLLIVCALMVSACGFEPLSPADVSLRYEAVTGCKLRVSKDVVDSGSIRMTTARRCPGAFPAIITLPQTEADLNSILNGTIQGESPYEDIRFWGGSPSAEGCVMEYIQVEAALVSTLCLDESIEALRLTARNLRMAIG